MDDFRLLSKTLSHALRHEPCHYSLELDEEGWVSLDAVVEALRNHQDAWRLLTAGDIEQVVTTSATRRHEICDGKIRALYGHSIAVSLARYKAVPPLHLFHGTSPKAARQVCAEGLRALGRQYVHLSVDAATAREIGRRKATDPVVFLVRAADAHSRDVPFYLGNERIWLAQSVPPEFLAHFCCR